MPWNRLTVDARIAIFTVILVAFTFMVVGTVFTVMNAPLPVVAACLVAFIAAGGVSVTVMHDIIQSIDSE